VQSAAIRNRLLVHGILFTGRVSTSGGPLMNDASRERGQLLD
jgi:hypothetical protein